MEIDLVFDHFKTILTILLPQTDHLRVKILPHVLLTIAGNFLNNLRDPSDGFEIHSETLALHLVTTRVTLGVLNQDSDFSDSLKIEIACKFSNEVQSIFKGFLKCLYIFEIFVRLFER